MSATFVIIGAMKSGTSTLRQHLRTHPEVSVTRRNEVNFFYEAGNWSRGPDWYARQFDIDKPVRGDLSPNYTKAITFPGVPERMHRLIPAARLVYILRDPIARAVSHFAHNVAHGRERRDIETALSDLETSGYIDASRYYQQLSGYLRFFDPETVLLVTMESLAREPLNIMRTVFRHIGAAPDHSPPGLGRVFHRGNVKRAPSLLTRPLVNLPGGKAIRSLVGPLLEARVEKPQLRPAQRERLTQAFGPDVEALRAFSGQAFSEWSI